MNLFKTAKPHLASVKNYVPGKPLEELEREYGVKNAVKMASNENALGPSPKAMAAVKKALSRAHRYPEGGCHHLRKKLSRLLGVNADQLVFGNGSDELLVFAARAFVGAGDEVITADPSFLIYEIAGSAENARVVKIPMKDFRYDLERMLGAVSAKTKVIFIANPDNPVGTYIPAARLSSFLSRVPREVLVVLDEAYFEFARVKKDYPDSLKLLSEFKNLLVTRTFSKAYGLAGLRVGYAVTSPEIARTLEKVREPFNVNSLAQAAAVAALDDKSFLKKSVRTVNEGRKLLSDELKKMDLRLVDTVTNFILFDVKRDTAPVYEKLLKAGVIVRPMGGWGLKTFLRVTIGTKSDNKRFLKALKKALALALFALMTQASAQADIIAHKNGQKLEGLITSENERQVTIEVEGMGIAVDRADIASLTKSPVAPKQPVPTAEEIEQAASAPAPGPASPGTDYSKLEKPLPVFDERRWKLDYENAHANQVVAVFHPWGESNEKWNEQYTAQLFIGLRSEPRHYAEYVSRKTAEGCPSTQWTTLKETPQEVMYAWSVKDCPKVTDQTEIVRVYLGQDGLHALHYAVKLGEMPEEERAKWIKILEATQFVKP